MNCPAHSPVPMPERIQRLPRDRVRQLPVPWFVAWLEHDKECASGKGLPDFRIIGSGRIEAAHTRRLCWICGEPLGAYLAFPIGPMCAINRTTAEPPSHRECAEYAVKACPFLSNPDATRRPVLLDKKDAAGVGLQRNPGATCVWVTQRYTPFRVGDAPGAEPGVLFEIGEPVEVLWYAEGRAATRAEVLASIDGGLPLLRAACKGDPYGEDNALAALQAMTDRAMTYLPKGP